MKTVFLSAFAVIMIYVAGHSALASFNPNTANGYGTAVRQFIIPAMPSTALPAPAATQTSSSGQPDNSTTTPATISDTSANWAGYVATGGTYSAVTGSWVVPSVTTSAAPLAADASWIGIGGVGSDDLIQIGTQNIVEGGQVSTGTFYERLPNASEDIPTVNVSPGDHITASVREVSAGNWALSITDTTNGEAFNNVVAYDSSHTSAEWIEEAPSSEGGVMPLDQFGSVSFTGGSTTVNGHDLSIAASNAHAVSMAGYAGQTVAQASILDNNGDGFSVSQANASTNGYGYSQSFADSTSNNAVGSDSGWYHSEPGLRSWHHHRQTVI